MSADPARQAALDLITAALGRGRPGDEALKAAASRGLLAAGPRLRPRPGHGGAAPAGADRPGARRREEPPPEPVRMILRLGAAQLFYLDTPAYAAVDSSVELAAAGNATRPFKALVNAVLRGLGREGAPADDPARGPVPRLALRPLAGRLRRPDGGPAIAAMIAEEPATDLTPRDPADAAGPRRGAGGRAAAGRLAAHAPAAAA